MNANTAKQTTYKHSAVVASAIVTLLLPWSALLSGCAFTNRHNTPITNAVERKLSAASPNAQKALLPVVLPIAVATLTVDALIVHPALVVDDALDDTKDALWDDFDWDTQFATECFKLPWRAVFTPIVFGFDWVGRAIFDVEPHGQDEVVQKAAEETLAKAARKLEERPPQEVGTVLDEIPAEDVQRLTQTQKSRYYVLRLRSAYAAGDYTWFHDLEWHHRHGLRNSEIQADLLAILEEMLNSEEAFTRLTAFRFAWQWLPESAGQEYHRRQLGDPDPMIRFDALNPVSSYINYGREPEYAAETFGVIKRMAAEDASPIIRACAGEIVRDANNLE